MKRLLLVTICVAFIIGCKNKETVKSITPDTHLEEEKELVVDISFKTNKEDEFKLMLNDIVVDDFQKRNIHIIEKVFPNSIFESLSAKFKTDKLSKNFYINFGNKSEKEIVIEYINLSYGNNSIEIKPEDIGEYFTLNKFIELDSISNNLRTYKRDGGLNPAIVLSRKVLNNLGKEVE